MLFRVVKIKIPGPGDVNDVTGSVRGEFGGILKKSEVELRTRLRTGRVDFRYLAVALWRVPHVLGRGADGKASIERLGISLPYVETFYSKVIRGFVPELRSRYVFFVFRDSCVLCIYVINNLCTFHISVSWVCYSSVSSTENDINKRLEKAWTYIN